MDSNYLFLMAPLFPICCFCGACLVFICSPVKTQPETCGQVIIVVESLPT
jgi:hypothetical protein